MGGFWYLAVFVPADESALTDAVARAVWPDDPNGSTQLTVRLVDAAGVAWRGANAAVTNAEIAALQGLAAVPGVVWFRYAADGALGAAYPPGPTIGAAWDWASSVAAAGLTVVDGLAAAVGLG